MKTPAALETYRPLVAAGLRRFIKRHQASGPAWEKDVMERLSGFVTSGKLMRGCLVCYSYKLCGGSDLPEAVINAAVAIELMHCGLLVHDDIMDQDDVRRGQPALHRQYAGLTGLRHSAADRLGENLAICAGDIALVLAFELLDTELAGLFARELAKVCAGQMSDTYAGSLPKLPAKRVIYEIMRDKTATYSIALPLVAGAALAGQSAATRQRLYDLGLATGTIFQIRDDELGVFGQAADMGKPVGSDIREGKKTLLYYYLWRASIADERRQLAAIFGNPEASPADIDYVRQAMQKHKVPVRIREDVDRLRQLAHGHIGKLDFDREIKAGLKQMVKFCAARKT